MGAFQPPIRRRRTQRESNAPSRVWCVVKAHASVVATWQSDPRSRRCGNTVMGRLIVGFDSAWTRTKTGAIVGAVLDDHGAIRELGQPQLVRYPQAMEIISDWQVAQAPSSTLVLLDQPTIVANDTGQRPVEQIVCSTVSRRRGGMQTANKSRRDMFGEGAPVWKFLAAIGGSVDPFAEVVSTRVFETYPVLAMISLGWTLPDSQRPGGRLPKYNPERRKTFAIADWVHVCRPTAAKLDAEGATGTGSVD